jgi:small conductance mechanosensitive channel
MEDFMYKTADYISKHSVPILLAIAIFIIGQKAARIISSLAEKSILKSRGHATLALFGRNIVFYALMAFVLIAALNKVGVQTASFIAVLGAASLAIGLALQGSLSNFASGVLLILFQPFRVGDTVELMGVQGVVKEVQIFSTVLFTAEKKRVIIPNAKVTGDKIIVFPS